MARIVVNHSCNVLTDVHSNGYRSVRAPWEVAPEITVPKFRLRLAIEEAETVAQHILEAVQVARARLAEAETEATK